MPLRDNSKYLVDINGEPNEVKEIRKNIISSFDNLTFIDEGHHYYIDHDNGQREELTSVSNISHMFQDEFNTEAQAIAYAEKHGMTPEYWKEQWKYKSERACIAGTITHEFGESYMWMKHGCPELITEMCQIRYNKEKGWLIPITPKEEAAKAFIDSLPDSVYLITNEAKMHSCANQDNLKLSTNYAGTTDFLLYYDNPKNPEKSGVIIGDWKTNENIYSEYSRTHGKMLHYPFDDFFEEALSNYTIQLNAYQLCLESIGIKVIGRSLVWLKDDGKYEVVKLDNITDRIKKVLQ